MLIGDTNLIVLFARMAVVWYSLIIGSAQLSAKQATTINLDQHNRIAGEAAFYTPKDRLDRNLDMWYKNNRFILHGIQ